MTKTLEAKLISEVKNILNDHNVINSEDIGFKNLITSIEKYFVLDWYIKESIQASIKSEIKRYIIKIGIKQSIVDSILTEISKLLKELKEEKKQEIQAEDEIKLSDNTKSFSNKDIKSKISPKYYTIILDSNYLYNSYRDGGNFSEFSFNRPFYDLIEKIEEFDIYDCVNIAIPEVVCNEIIIQRIQKLKEEVNKIFEVIDNYKLPKNILEVKISSREYYYMEYEKSVIEELKRHIKDTNKRSNVEIIVIPYKKCSLESISKRAFYKQPPFEGKDKKSDKGFKDALIWESILEYKKLNSDRDIVFLSHDKGFNEELNLEFEKKFEDKIYIIKKDDILETLERIAEEIFTTIGDRPITAINNISYYKDLKEDFYNWRDTKNFDNQLISYMDKYIEMEERFIKFNKIINIDDVSLEYIEENNISLIIDCQIELENKIIKGEKFQVIEKFELRIKKDKDTFEIENISSLDY